MLSSFVQRASRRGSGLSVRGTDNKRLYSRDGERRKRRKRARPVGGTVRRAWRWRSAQQRERGLRTGVGEGAHVTVRPLLSEEVLGRTTLRAGLLASDRRSPRLLPQAGCGMATADHSPITVAAPRRNLTGFPILPDGGRDTRKATRTMRFSMSSKVIPQERSPAKKNLARPGSFGGLDSGEACVRAGVLVLDLSSSEPVRMQGRVRPRVAGILNPAPCTVSYLFFLL